MTPTAMDRGTLAMLLAQTRHFRDLLGLLPPFFAQAGIRDAEFEIRALLRALPRTEPAGPASFQSFLDARVTDQPVLFDTLAGWVARRLDREPLDRIIGSRGFWTLDLALSPATLSPRADTECVVEAARDHLRGPGTTTPLRMLDLGTGSGAILLALLLEFPSATGLGIDQAADAVETARVNAQINASLDASLPQRASFQVGNWFEGLEETFDLVISNPPYIPSALIAGLEPEVREHDPVLALDGGMDGLEAYRAIISSAADHLNSTGLLVFEIGFDQADAVTKLARSHGFVLQECRKDYDGQDRALVFNAAGAKTVANT